jgi:lysozyme family protein
MTDFEKCFENTVMLEGGYSDHPYDSGGKTKYGITESVAKSNGYLGDMKDLTLEFAKKIYKKDYWDANRLDELNNFDIKAEIFDTGVNCGIKTAAKFMQKAYNLLSTSNFIAVDGIVGKETIKALNNFLKQNRIVTVANAYQIKYYLEITEANSKNKAFIFGWLDKRGKL